MGVNFSLDSQEKRDIASWLQAPNASARYNELQEEHHEGTGEWFMNSDAYIHWYETRGSTLWIRGKRKFRLLGFRVSGELSSED
jgi:hypothetical protein